MYNTNNLKARKKGTSDRNLENNHLNHYRPFKPPVDHTSPQSTIQALTRPYEPIVTHTSVQSKYQKIPKTQLHYVDRDENSRP